MCERVCRDLYGKTQMTQMTQMEISLTRDFNRNLFEFQKESIATRHTSSIHDA